jgi:hypothetical protein
VKSRSVNRRFAAESRSGSFRAMARCRRLAAVLLALCASLCLAPGVGANQDPGLVLELDRARYEVSLRDMRTGDLGPRIRVVLGSPAHDTPSGDFPVGRVILNPAWHPSAEAMAAGARKRPPSLNGPMGVAKIPFADGGSIALHGGGDALLLGKPVSGGCVRARDADLLRIIAWLHARDTLGRPQRLADGEIHRGFHRPVHFRVR